MMSLHDVYQLAVGPFQEFAFMRRALIATFALALSSAPLGVMLTLRRMSLFGEALSHAVLPGVAIGFIFFGLSLPALSIGTFDVLVGINLLREGLDIPEVSLVAILDADKEGFLRSERSLIQTIGRAARNLNGMAILYGDKVTDSMHKAIGETERRRAKQVAFNEANGITPKGIKKEIRELIDGVYNPQEARTELLAAQETTNYEAMSEKQISKEIKRLEKLMQDHAKNLEFEKAAKVRDQLHQLKRQLFGAPGEDTAVA